MRAPHSHTRANQSGATCHGAKRGCVQPQCSCSNTAVHKLRVEAEVAASGMAPSSKVRMAEMAAVQSGCGGGWTLSRARVVEVRRRGAQWSCAVEVRRRGALRWRWRWR
jgi:hypothetical protein